MGRAYTKATALALPLVFASSVVTADVTPADIWGDWRDYMQGMGYAITGSEVPSADALTVNDLSLGFSLPDGGGQFALTLPTVTYQQLDDGKVSIIMPPVMPATLSFTPGANGGKPVTAAFEYRQTGQSSIASGTPQAVTYTYSAEALDLILTSLTIGPDTFGEDRAKVRINATGITSTTQMNIANLRGYNQQLAVASTSYDIRLDPPDEPTSVAIKGGRENVTFEGVGKLPLAFSSLDDMVAVLKSGFDFAANMTWGAGTQEFQTQDATQTMIANSLSQSGDFNLSMSQSGMTYAGAQNALSVTIQGAGVPIPLTLDMARAAFNLTTPVSASETAQDFAFGFTMADFTMSDFIWGLLDPQGQLPRDPATLDLDLTGKVKLDVEVLDPAATAKAGASAAGTVESMSLNRLRIAAVGAEATGTGAFTFDNSDMTTFDGFPKPVGQINLNIAGANALLDRIVAMGFIPQDEAMGFRMMLGLFGVPGAEPDTLSSTIEFTPDSQVLANGQRIR